MTFLRKTAVVMLMGILDASVTMADEMSIQHFSMSGELVFSGLSSANVYTVESATAMEGPWICSKALPGGLGHILTTKVDEASTAFVRMVATMTNAVVPPPVNMVLIPAGYFLMGDSFDTNNLDELPRHPVYLSAYYIERHEVTRDLWLDVVSWAVINGYTFNNSASGKAPDHPIYHLDWYDAAKWCNARSEMEDRIPAYYTSDSLAPSAVYRTGRSVLSNQCVRWDAGYRLPTEAEWEKAARGGANGRRFPWSDADTIDFDRANYESYWVIGEDHPYHDWDKATNSGCHPLYSTGREPHTSPVGSFPPNDYGLYDMAGNIWEWCWDQHYQYYYTNSPTINPLGPNVGTSRAIRGGSWTDTSSCRVSRRHSGPPTLAGITLGFRVVLPVPP